MNANSSLRHEGHSLNMICNLGSSETPFSPLTLTLSPKGREGITFDNRSISIKKENADEGLLR
jgi:hypothetical protein